MRQQAPTLRVFLVLVAIIALAGSAWGVAVSAFTASTTNGSSTIAAATDFSVGELDLWGGGHAYVPTPFSSATTWTSVSSADLTTCGIRSDTTLWCWGEARSGLGDTIPHTTPTQVTSPSTTGWTAVSAGGVHTCAIRTGGTLWCWGTNANGQLGIGSVTAQLSPTQVTSTSSGWTAISIGDYYSCGLRPALWCWGANANGQLGVNSTTNANVPTQVTSPSLSWSSVRPGAEPHLRPDHRRRPLLLGFRWLGHARPGQLHPVHHPAAGHLAVVDRLVNLTSGYDFTCAMRTSSLYCWGRNIEGQLGVGDNTDRTTPTQVTGTWTGVVAGIRQACGIKAGPPGVVLGPEHRGPGGHRRHHQHHQPAPGVGDGHVVPDGGPDQPPDVIFKTDGTLAAWGRFLNRPMSPTQIGALVTWDGRGLAAGLSHACGLQTDTSLWCWGQNTDGRVGTGGHLDVRGHPPVQISSPGPAPGGPRSAPGSHTCGIRSGPLYCWGSNTTVSSASAAPPTSPRRSGGCGDELVVVSGGVAHTCGMRATALYCWGNNATGQLGIGSTTDATAPSLVAGTWSSVTVGSTHSCGIKTAGTLWCWGIGNDGRLGLGNATQFTSPQQVGALTTWSSVAAGGSSNCGILAAGTLWCWGYNANGQLGQGNAADVDLADPGRLGDDVAHGERRAGQLLRYADRPCRALLGEGRLRRQRGRQQPQHQDVADRDLRLPGPPGDRRRHLQDVLRHPLNRACSARRSGTGHPTARQSTM